MKYKQLEEAIIKVPNALMHKVNLYVSSYLYYKLNQFVTNIDQMLPQNTAPEEKQKKITDAKQTMAKLYSKYNASNITSSTANQLINNSIDLKVDIEQFFKELNFKGVSPGLVNLLKNKFKFELMLTSGTHGQRGSLENNDPYHSRINVDVNNLKANPSFMETANQIMSTAYHEAQHAVQAIALKNINKKSNQLQIKPGYSDTNDEHAEYYSSGIEFTPQLGNVIDDVVNFLERDALNDKLNDNKNEAIKDALQRSVQDKSASTRPFLTNLYKKEPEKYKKALKAIYTKVSPVYDDLKANGINYSYSDVPAEDLDVKVNVMASAYKKLKSKPDSFKLELFGNSIEDISRIRCTSKNHDWILDITRSNVKSNTYNLRLQYGNYEDTFDVNSQELLNIVGIISDLTYMEADDVLENIDYFNSDIQKASNENINESIQQLSHVAEMYNVQFKQTSDSTFNLFGKEFKIEPTSETKIALEDESGEVFMILSLKQFVLLFQNLIRIYSDDEEFVNNLLKGGYTYIECMSKIGEL